MVMISVDPVGFSKYFPKLSVNFGGGRGIA
jgi:hypothetical protein